MTESQKNNPLHGITLEMMLNYLHATYGWEQMSYHIPINCFKSDPSIKSSLKFLRKTPWARLKVEALFAHIAKDGIDETLIQPKTK